MLVEAVLVLHGNPLVAQFLSDQARVAYPGAECIVCADTTEAFSILTASRVDIFLTGLEFEDVDLLDSLLHFSRRARAAVRTLVVTGPQGARVLVTLRRLEVAGVINLAEDSDNFHAAFTAIAGGQRYWSQSFVDVLLSDDARLVVHRLSPGEQLALSFMGDACSDKVAADRLGMAMSTVRSLRQALYAKLHVHDKEGLQRMAARLSFTRFSPRGMVAMGAAIVMLEYMERSQRPVELPAATVVRRGFATHEDLDGSKPLLRQSG